MSEIITLPAIALRGMSVLPSMIVHFDVSREKSITALNKAVSSDRSIFLVTQKNPTQENVRREDVYDNGVIAEIKNIARLPHGLVRVMVEGRVKAELKTLTEKEGMLFAGVSPVEEIFLEETSETIAMLQGMKDIFTVYAQEQPKISKEFSKQILEVEKLPELVRQLSCGLPMEFEQRQTLLDAEDVYSLYDLLCEMMAKEIEISRIRSELQMKVKERVDQNQKEYYLREQLKVIQEELGEAAPFQEADQYLEQLEKLHAPEEVKEKIKKEIRRFKSLGGNSAEASVSRNYIETLLEMPWLEYTEDNLDLREAKRILDEDHYGLEKVKERVLEYLAVRQLAEKGMSPILCLAGPPGTGKTSIARSVARAMGRKYIRISLGGVRDEAEIRGHRRTYIGAMPGRIVTGLKNAGVANPLMLLDEIDKLGTSLNGDPSSAMLEVLDGEQNSHFSDHYIEIPVDLSDVMFIATANDLSSIPAPLLDRMEVIEVSSYTANEKFHIAKEHLLGKQRKMHGLHTKQLNISDKAIREIISGYTRESGVRKLERKIGEICRKAAREILEEKSGSVRVKGSNLEAYLGKQLYRPEAKNAQDEVGIVRGLAWTQVGGVTLEVEVNTMPGKGELVLTGQLGDVMRESARAAISFVRSIASSYGVDPEVFQKNDFHVHIPEGATPKDGPSAGITMATALLSAVSGRRVRADIAMTGEITLRGRVLPIGGLKEKTLAAKNAGMRMVLVPEDNKKDILELSEEITGGLDIRFVKDMQQVLDAALV